MYRAGWTRLSSPAGSEAAGWLRIEPRQPGDAAGVRQRSTGSTRGFVGLSVPGRHIAKSRGDS